MKRRFFLQALTAIAVSTPFLGATTREGRLYLDSINPCKEIYIRGVIVNPWSISVPPQPTHDFSCDAKEFR
jgi:hypothetical protein